MSGEPLRPESLFSLASHEYLIDHGERNVIYFDDWSENERPLNQVLSACLPEGHRTQNELIYGHHVVILDEAQYSYRDRKLVHRHENSLWGRFRCPVLHLQLSGSSDI